MHLRFINALGIYKPMETDLKRKPTDYLHPEEVAELARIEAEIEKLTANRRVCASDRHRIIARAINRRRKQRTSGE